MTTNAQVVETLRWQKFHCLGESGWICLVDAMGDDEAIVQAARVSYGKGTKSVSDDRGLIRYLMRNSHTTPFEMAEVKLLVRCPMDVWRQWIRHRTANVNEYSTRYSEAPEDFFSTEPTKWRAQATDNKQGSSGFVEDWPEDWKTEDPTEFHTPSHPINTERSNCKTIGDYLSSMEECLHGHALEVYKERLAAGVAREQARKDLPLSTFTEAYWKCDLHNIFNFLRLRCDAHAQYEIRQYANAMLEIVDQLFPISTEAFRDYVLRGMRLSALEIQTIARYIEHGGLPHTEQIMERGGTFFAELPDDFKANNSRERAECIRKMKVLGLLRSSLKSQTPTSS